MSVCAASCSKTTFVNSYTQQCNLYGARVIAFAVSLCGVDLACPTVKEDIDAQIAAGTLVLVKVVKAEVSQPTHNYRDVNYSYLAARTKTDSTYNVTIDTPISIENKDFWAEVDNGDYKDVIFITEDGPMLQPDSSRIDIAVGTGPDGDGNLSQRLEIQWTQKAGQMKVYQGREPLYVAEDE